jgi:hypothetical protein
LVHNQPLRWRERLAGKAYEHLPTAAEVALKKCFPYVLPFANLAVPISILRGPVGSNGTSGAVLVAGAGEGINYLVSRFFGDEYKEEILGKVPLWNLSHTLKSLRSSTDLAIARVDRLSSGLLFDKYYLAAPEWVGSMLEVPENLEELSRGNPSLKFDLKTVRLNGFTTDISEKKEDCDQFHSTMYVPLIRKRHGEEAFVSSIQRVRRVFSQGGLIWARQNGYAVAGGVFQIRGKTLVFEILGTLGGEWNIVEEGGVAALYLCILNHARKVGCKFIDFGGSRPSLTDGVLRYKHKWRVNLVEKKDAWYDFLVYWSEFNEKVAHFLSQTPLIFRDQGGLSGIKVLDEREKVTARYTEKIRRSLWMPGLKSLYLLFSQDWKEAQCINRETVLVRMTGRNGSDRWREGEIRI